MAALSLKQQGSRERLEGLQGLEGSLSALYRKSLLSPLPAGEGAGCGERLVTWEGSWLKGQHSACGEQMRARKRPPLKLERPWWVPEPPPLRRSTLLVSL